LNEAKDHLRLDHSDHDTQIQGLIQASREWIEMICGRALVEQTRAVLYREWPEQIFEIPYPSIQNVDSVKYTDTDGTQHTLDSSTYSVVLDREPGQLVLRL